MADKVNVYGKIRMANHDKIYGHIKHDPMFSENQFSYKDIKKVALNIAGKYGAEYAALKCLQKYCISNGGSNDMEFFSGDPRDYKQLLELKSTWKFMLKNRDCYVHEVMESPARNVENNNNICTNTHKIETVQFMEYQDVYLLKPSVSGFVNYLRNLLSSNETPFVHTQKSKDGKNKWECTSLYDARMKYKWDGQDFDSNNRQLEELSTRLYEAVNKQDEIGALKVCMDILSWGGVITGAYWVAKLYLENNLTRSISEAVQALTGNPAILQNFTFTKDQYDNEFEIYGSQNVGKGKSVARSLRYRLNASFTKIYSLYSKKPFMIYDSRVAAAMGLLAKRYWQDNPSGLPDELRFGRLEGRGSGTRDASIDNINFKKADGDYKHALWNVRSNWIVCAALEGCDFAGETELKKKMRAVEAALFMIGKSV